MNNLMEINYTDPVNHLSEEDVFIGDDTRALLIDNRDNEGEPTEGFFEEVVAFFIRFVKKH